jgi:hypothetical protein
MESIWGGVELMVMQAYELTRQMNSHFTPAVTKVKRSAQNTHKSGHKPWQGFDTKTDRMNDRQLQKELDLGGGGILIYWKVLGKSA